MNFLPAIPNVVQQTYGQGYGSFQPYSGHSKSNQFGDNSQMGVQPSSSAAVAPPSQGSQPQSFSDAFNQKLDNFTSGISAKAGKISNAYNQAMSGNGYAAVQALKGNNQPTPVIDQSVIGDETGMQPEQ
jgi:hypothetical protein